MDSRMNILISSVRVCFTSFSSCSKGSLPPSILLSFHLNLQVRAWQLALGRKQDVCQHLVDGSQHLVNRLSSMQFPFCVRTGSENGTGTNISHCSLSIFLPCWNFSMSGKSG